MTLQLVLSLIADILLLGLCTVAGFTWGQSLGFRRGYKQRDIDERKRKNGKIS